MKPKVAVLMPTFKASSFLKNQLFSIISQNDVDVHLFIFNDGCDIKTDKIIIATERAIAKIAIRIIGRV